MSFRAAAYVILCAFLVFFLHREEQRGTLDEFERFYLAWLVGNSSEQIRDPAITFVRLDEEEEEVFENWPLTRLDYAVVLKNLEKYSPDVIMVVPVLGWENEDEISTNVLRTQLLRVPQVLLGCVLENDPLREDAATPHARGIIDSFPAISNIEGDVSRIPGFNGLADTPDAPLLPGVDLGFTRFDLDPEADTSPLKIPLLARHGDSIVPSFVLQALLIQHQRSAPDIVVRLGESIRITGTPVVIPIDRSGFLSVFSGLRHRIPRLNASVLLLAKNPDLGIGQLQEGHERELESLVENIVLIGEDDAGARTTAVDDELQISQAELLALAIATIQSARYISRWPASWQYLLWASLVFAGLGILRRPRRRALFLSFLLLLCYIVACLLMFQSRLAWMPLSIPLALIVATALWGCLFPPRN